MSQRPGQFLTIIEPNAEPFDWRFYDDERDLTYDTVFVLRALTESEQEELRRKHTTRQFNKKTRGYEDNTNWTGYTTDALDLGIMDWRDLQNKAGQDVPCTREMKRALPSRVRAEILRVVLGREVDADGATDADAGDAAEPVGASRKNG